MRNYCFLFVFFVFGVSAFSEQKKDFLLEITPYFSFSKGCLNELIYSSSDDSIMKSKLEWNLNSLYQFGAKAKFGWKNIYILGNADFALPVKCGTLYDSDWNASGEIKTIYSKLEENVGLIFNSSIGLGYNFSLANKNTEKKYFTFSPLFTFDYSYFKIEAGNGFGYFGAEDYSLNGKDVPWNSEYAAYHKVYGIDLERLYFNFFSGFLCEIYPSEKILFGFNLNFSFFSYIVTYDKHFAKNSWYNLNGYQKGSFDYLKFSVYSSYKFSSNIAALIELDLLNGNLMKGNFYHNYYSSKPVLSRQKSGSSTILYGLKIGMTFSVF